MDMKITKSSDVIQIFISNEKLSKLKSKAEPKNLPAMVN